MCLIDNLGATFGGARTRVSQICAEYAQAATLCAAIRSQTPADGHQAVAIPGDRGHAKWEAAMRSGEIEITDELYRGLKKRASV